jgi:hypothetical protein
VSGEQQQGVFVIKLFCKFTIYFLAVGRESVMHPAFSNRFIPNLCLNILAPLFLGYVPFLDHAAERRRKLLTEINAKGEMRFAFPT